MPSFDARRFDFESRERAECRLFGGGGSDDGANDGGSGDGDSNSRVGVGGSSACVSVPYTAQLASICLR